MTGATAIVTLLAAHWAIAAFRRRVRRVRVTDGPANVLVAEGEIQPEQLARAGLTVEDLHVLLRERQIFAVSDVDYVLLEARGAVCVHRTGAPLGPLLLDALAAAGYAPAAVSRPMP